MTRAERESADVSWAGWTAIRTGSGERLIGERPRTLLDMVGTWRFRLSVSSAAVSWLG